MLKLEYVSKDGLNTKTPELKQSGQPTSDAAENSSRSNKSSTFLIRAVQKRVKIKFIYTHQIMKIL